MPNVISRNWLFGEFHRPQSTHLVGRSWISFFFQHDKVFIYFNQKKEWLDSEPLDPTIFFRQAGVTSFFLQSMIDLPVVLKKSKSLFSQTFRLPQIRLLNLLMRHGQRRLVWSRWTSAEVQVLHNYHQNLGQASFCESWFGFRYVENVLRGIWTTDMGRLDLPALPDCKLGRVIFRNAYYFAPEFSIEKFLFLILSRQTPLFMFFIKKNDKMRRKHGRGKVEKLKVMWKYIPPYKRLYQSMRWFLRDLRFQKNPLFLSRMLQTIETLFLTPRNSFLIQTQSFVHRFVFKKYQKTLLTTLRTTA